MPGFFRCVAKPMLIKSATGRSILTPLASSGPRLIGRACNNPGLLRPQWRAFASKNKGRNGGRDGKIRAVEPLAVTWLAPQPSAVTTDHIISNLPILPPTSERQHDILVFLATPAFAPWMDESHSFLKESIRHIFQDAHGPACVHDEFHAVVAVVDKLPAPRGQIEGSSKDTGGTGDGFEGLSMLLVDRGLLTGEIAKGTVGRGSLPSEPVITYSVKSPPWENRQLVSHEVGLRLANTLFVNGNHRTIFASSWRHDRENDDLILKQKIDLSGCKIGSTSEPKVKMEIPLHAVTRRRKALFSMGNILRQISKGDESDEPVPASSELEKELPRYVKQNNLTNQRLAVWALVEPSVELGTDSSTGMEASRIPHSIRNGARLHRVVSGGGGWGKKQGLLSLDPEVQFTGDHAVARPIVELLNNNSAYHDKLATAKDSLPPGFPSFDGESEITSINQIAKDGEFVQFFVAPEEGSVGSELNSASGTAVDKNGAGVSSTPTLTCTFGVISTPDDGIPATQESDPSTVINTEGSDESASVISLKNYFGALSEKGITYSSFVSAEAPGEPEESGKQLSHTKIGAPGARVRFV